MENENYCASCGMGDGESTWGTIGEEVPAEKVSSEKIVVIGPKTCSFCNVAMAKLTKEFGADFVEKKNVEDSDPLVASLMKEGFSFFPVLSYNGNHYDGVREALDKFIQDKKSGKI